MNQYEIYSLRDHPHLVAQAAHWFHQNWGIPEEAYQESMANCLRNRNPVPQWYVMLNGNAIVAGLGVIENDFHDRKDLTPNVCAVYTEESHRNQGLAGRLLRYACEDFHAMDIDTLYLLTDHTSFYERYGWTFFCMAQGDGEATPSRMYVHRYTS